METKRAVWFLVALVGITTAPRPARADAVEDAPPPTSTPAPAKRDERVAYQLSFLGFRTRILDAPGDLSADRAARRRIETFGVSLLGIDLDARSGVLAYRGALDFAVGGGAFDGSSTLDGTARGAAMFGVVSGRDGGVFGRLGAAFDLSGTRAASRLMMEVPRLELGSQWMKGPLFFEAGPSAGIAVLNGVVVDRYGADLGVQPTWGGFVVAQHGGRPGPNTRFRIELVRSEAIGLDAARAVTTVRGRLCAQAFGPLVLCADGDVLWTAVPFQRTAAGSSEQVVNVRQTAAAFGLTLAFGGVGTSGR
jgi:hypothetical protein